MECREPFSQYLASSQSLPSQLFLGGIMRVILEDDVQTVLRLDETDVLYDVVVVQVLEEVDLGLAVTHQHSLLLISRFDPLHLHVLYQGVRAVVDGPRSCAVRSWAGWQS